MSLILSCSGAADSEAEQSSSADHLTGGDSTNDEPADMADGEAHDAVSSAATCIAQYPATVPFDIGESSEVASPMLMGGAAPPSRTVDTIAAECTAGGGGDCDARQFISMQAALCISERDVMKPEMETSRRAGLLFRESGRVEWSVEVTFPYQFNPDDLYCSGYLFIHIDAVTGSIQSAAELSGCG